VSTDAELVQRSVDDPAAFTGIFERHIDTVLAYARRRVGATDGEEIAAQNLPRRVQLRARFDPS